MRTIQNNDCRGLGKYGEDAVEMAMGRCNLFDFKSIFPKPDEFGLFVTTLSGGSESLEIMKLLVNVQQNYLVGIADYTSSSIGEDSYRMSSTLLEEAANHTNNKPVDEEVLYNDSADVCIGNVPSTATRKRLVGLFKLAGWIEKIVFDRSNETAMVRFAEVSYATNLLACSEPFYLDNCELEIGIKSLSFVRCDDKQKKGNNVDPNPLDLTDYSNEVRVSNIPDLSTEKQLVKLLEFAGHIDAVVIDRKSRTAVVRFENKECVHNLRLLLCKKTFQLKGCKLGIEKTKSNRCDVKKEPDVHHKNASSDSEVLVSNLPPNASSGLLVKTFLFKLSLYELDKLLVVN